MQNNGDRNKIGYRTSFLVAIALMGCLGCMSQTFEHVQPVTDDNYQELVMESDRPVLVYFHAGLSKATTKAFGPVLEEFAASFGDDMDFFHCNPNENKALGRKANLECANSAVLVKNGKCLPHAVIGYADVDDNRGALLAAVGPILYPPSGKKKAVEELAKDDFQSKVIDALGPVVLNLSRIRGGRGALPFARHFKETGKRHGNLASFYEVNDESFSELCETPSETSIVIYSNGERISFYDGGFYKEAEANENLILGQLAKVYLDVAP